MGVGEEALSSPLINLAILLVLVKEDDNIVLHKLNLIQLLMPPRTERNDSHVLRDQRKIFKLAASRLIQIPARLQRPSVYQESKRHLSRGNHATNSRDDTRRRTTMNQVQTSKRLS